VRKYTQDEFVYMAGKKGMNRFSAESKMAAVQTYLKVGKTRRQIAKEVGIANGDSIKG
jgi:transposase-like protein